MPPIEIATVRGTDWAWLSIAPIPRIDFDIYGADRIAELFAALTASVKAEFGRTHAANGIGDAEEYEADGLIDYLDWLVYFGPNTVRRWGVESLLRAPAYRSLATAEGGCVLLLGASPFEPLVSRRKVAESLGIGLRPLTARNARGEPVPVEWE
jgi:hypothetical protein